MKESPLKLSDANLWVNCTGAIELCQKFDKLELSGEQSEARLDGRAFHEVAQSILNNFKDPVANQILPVGWMSGDSVLIADEIFESAKVYADDVMAYCNTDKLRDDLQVEKRVCTDHLSDDTYGFVDAYVYDPQTMTLTVWEGKYGHSYVSEFENWQLISYVSGILEEMVINGISDQMISVDMRVAQPRCFSSPSVRSWKCKASDLRAHVNTIIAAAAQALNAGQCKVGTWCGTCPARHVCTTLQRVNYQGIDYESNAQGNLLSGNDLSLELTILRRAETALKARLSGVESQVLSDIKRGNSIPGFTSQQGYGRKRWKKDTPVDEVIAMGDMMDIDLRKPVQLDTPAQAIKKGLGESVISMYSETPLGKVKIVEQNNDELRRTFQNVKK